MSLTRRPSADSGPVRGVLVLLAALLLGLTGAPAAHAHPLGNFSINHHDGVRLFPDRVEDTAVVDSAEIPTAQERETADTDHDGTVSPAERARSARARCAQLASAAQVWVNGERIPLRVRGSRLVHGEGAAGLPIARLSCRLRADADLSRPARVSFTSAAEAARTGWKEITATAHGVRLTGSDVPARSASEGLRRYPSGAADEPLNQTRAHLRTEPGTGGAATTEETGPGAAPALASGAILFPALENRLTSLTTGHDLTLPVGLLAVLLTVLLGAGHAALPGHAKLAVAACLARREGGVRAALAVGATVTATHTAGVLVVGLVLTVSGGLLGEQLLGWLGALSGVLIAAIGTGLVVTAARALRTGNPAANWHHGHGHGHAHAHAHGHGHGHGHQHGHGHSHSYSLKQGQGQGLGHGHPPAPDPGHDNHHGTRRTPTLRLPSLLGVGLAGGLVPSPSALVVLLGAVALSRTSFGVLLVLGYGLGMAATLTAAGLLLSGGGGRLAALGERRLPALRRYTRYGTLLTALAVLTVGLGLVLRSVLPW